VQQVGRAVGSIVAATTVPGRRFGVAEQETLQAFADQAGIALTEQQMFQEMQQGYTDPLTGLANRALLHDQLTAAVELAGSGGAGPAVLFVDLDGFKLVNDTLGHAVGDELLGQVADRLRAVVAAPAMIGRFGGDEFLVLLPAVTAIGEATAAAQRLLGSLTRHLEVAGHDVSVSASIGIAWAGYPAVVSGSAAATTVDLLRRADTAMYRAKGLGRGRFAVFQDSMYDDLVRAVDRERQLHEALESDAMTAQFQPVVDLATGQAVGAEALVRWSRDGELVAPAEFIDLAEESGLILALGRKVLRRACTAMADWRHAGVGALSMSVNLSVRQLESPTLADDLAHEIFRAGVSPSDLVVELTESTLMRDVTAMTERLATLRALGVRIALDDFGTGYSSLARLRWLPLDILKIDRSFVDQIDSDPLSRAMAATVLQLALALDLDVVAEGVERESQRQVLVDLGVRVGQGYLFARPMDADALTERLVAEKAARGRAAER
jgi:diguanylate cyclase (GGDEF)-like protein